MNTEPGSGDVFVTTRWTQVVAAGRRSSPGSEKALAELCGAYWYPLYVYVRRRGHERADAEDLTQGFFERFLAKNWLEGVSAERGRFRAFLLAAMKHYLANEWDRSQRQKRGGGVQVLSLDWDEADERFRVEPPDPETPERAYDREWALALLQRVIDRLGLEHAAAGRGAFFERAKGFLTGESDAYAAAAAGLGMEEGALRVAVHRLRRRYRELLRDEIAQTLADAGDVEEELRSLRAGLAGA